MSAMQLLSSDTTIYWTVMVLMTATFTSLRWLAVAAETHTSNIKQYKCTQLVRVLFGLCQNEVLFQASLPSNNRT
jgi:hypothetical protein